MDLMVLVLDLTSKDQQADQALKDKIDIMTTEIILALQVVDIKMKDLITDMKIIVISEEIHLQWIAIIIHLEIIWDGMRIANIAQDPHFHLDGGGGGDYRGSSSSPRYYSGGGRGGEDPYLTNSGRYNDLPPPAPLSYDSPPWGSDQGSESQLTNDSNTTIRAAALQNANSNAVETAASRALKAEQAAAAAALAVIEEQKHYQFAALLALRGSNLSTIIRPASTTLRTLPANMYQMQSVADILGLDRTLTKQKEIVVKTETSPVIEVTGSAGDVKPPVPLAPPPVTVPEAPSSLPAIPSAVKRQSSTGSVHSVRSVIGGGSKTPIKEEGEETSSPLLTAGTSPASATVKVRKLSKIQPPSKTAMRAAAAAAALAAANGTAVPSSPAVGVPQSTPVKPSIVTAGGGGSTPSITTASANTTPRTKQNSSGGITAAGVAVSAINLSAVKSVPGVAGGVINAGTEASPRYFSAGAPPPPTTPHPARQLPGAPVTTPSTPLQPPAVSRATSVDVNTNSGVKRPFPAQPALNRGQSTPVGGHQHSKGPGLPPSGQNQNQGYNNQQQHRDGYPPNNNNNYNNRGGAGWNQQGGGRDYPQNGGYNDYPQDAYQGGGYPPQGQGQGGRGRSRSRSPPPFYPQGGGGGMRDDRGAYPQDYRDDYRGGGGGGYDDYNYPPDPRDGYRGGGGGAAYPPNNREGG
eukprot:gene32908-40626_t